MPFPLLLPSHLRQDIIYGRPKLQLKHFRLGTVQLFAYLLYRNTLTLTYLLTYLLT